MDPGSERFTGLPERPPPRAPVDLAARLGGGPRPARVVLIGCGVVFLLLGVAAVIFMLRADDFVGWVFGSLEETVMARLPPDLPSADRRRLEAAFGSARERVESGEGDPDAMRRLQAELTALARDGAGGPLTREQVARIIAALEGVVGSGEGGAAKGAAPRASPGAGTAPDSDRP
jgi:hypothetical protein